MTRGRVRVVVTGIGAITPLGLSAEETWQKLVAGQSGVAIGESYDASEYPVKIAAEVRGFEPGKYINFKEARRMARFSQLAVGAAREALLKAGLIIDSDSPTDQHVNGVDQSRIGVVLGTCAGGLVEIRNATQTVLEKGYRRVGPMFIPRMMHNAAAANIAHQFGLMGYNTTITTACASGSQAIGDATAVIRQGRADVMVTGGTEAAISDVGQAGFWSTRAMTSAYNDDPEKASRPFDLNRDGIVIAEGAACLVLERLEHALARDAPILAEIVGFGCSGDAYHLTAPHPNGDGEVRAMTWALEEADLSPEDVDYVSAHATSTPIGDKIETLAIKRVFGETAYEVPISSAKSMLGHAVAAAGAVEAIASILTIRDGVIHPTINYDTPDPECDLDYVPNKSRKAKVDIVLSNSFGMGGQNAALVISRV
jgi:3-oxoacyl-[acyl-carrier-protein] synthase II